MFFGVGVFGISFMVCVIILLFKDEGFVVKVLWGCMLEEVEELVKEMSVFFYISCIDEVLLY